MARIKYIELSESERAELKKAYREGKTHSYRRRCQTGRGRKPILDSEEDLEAVKKAIENNRKKLSLAKAELEEALNKRFSNDTLKRYIKNSVDAINASENVPYTKAMKRSMS